MKLAKLLFIASLQFSTLRLTGQTIELKNQIENFIKIKNADIGIAILNFENSDSILIGNNNHYPMQSVYKFHLALAVLDQVDKGKLSLNKNVFISKADLLPNTWSPLRDKYPTGEIAIPLSEILNYTISQSDNNGCDILFKLIGGVNFVNDYIHNLGINEIEIKTTEAEMHKDWDTQFTNWTTPSSMTILLEKFYKKNILSKSSFDFLWNAMVKTTTGPLRLKGLLPTSAIVAHKTGTSSTNKQGVTAAINDIGIITLPNKQSYAIAIFVSNSKENEETNQRIIAEISKMVWDYFSKN
jgi:beta-lactamase class A